MTLPASITMVQITGKLFTGDTPAIGTVLFQSSTRVTYVDEDLITIPSPYIARLANGSIQSMFMIPANDDGNPSLGTYKVTERIVGLTETIYHIQVLASNGSVQDLSDLAPMASSSGFSVVVGPRGIQGIQGVPGPAGLDSGTSIDLVLSTHVQSSTPHPIYDDTPDLTLLFQNGLT